VQKIGWSFFWVRIERTMEDHFVEEKRTFAKSKEHALNNVRARTFGPEVSFDELTRLGISLTIKPEIPVSACPASKPVLVRTTPVVVPSTYRQLYLL
jgi:hypothetical protein